MLNDVDEATKMKIHIISLVATTSPSKKKHPATNNTDA
jgi:hypothetical protein